MVSCEIDYRVVFLSRPVQYIVFARMRKGVATAVVVVLHLLGNGRQASTHRSVHAHSRYARFYFALKQTIGTAYLERYSIRRDRCEARREGEIETGRQNK